MFNPSQLGMMNPEVARILQGQGINLPTYSQSSQTMSGPVTTRSFQGSGQPLTVTSVNMAGPQQMNDVQSQAANTARIDLGPTPFDQDTILQENRDLREEMQRLAEQWTQDAQASRQDDLQFQRFQQDVARDAELERQLEVTSDDRRSSGVAWMDSLRGGRYSSGGRRY